MIFSTDSSIIDSQTKLPHFSDAPTDEPKDTLNYRNGLADKKKCNDFVLLLHGKYTDADLW